MTEDQQQPETTEDERPVETTEGEPEQHPERPGYGLTRKFPIPVETTEDDEDQEDEA